MYHIPSYIKITKENESLILKNLIAGSIAELEMKYFDEFISIHNKGVNKINTELELFLNKHNFLIDIKIFSKYFNQLIKYYNSFLNIVIMPTEYCNFNCSYCYENKNKISMTKKYYDTILNYISTKSKNKISLNIEWFGGEPTLKFSDIIKYNELFSKEAEKRNLKFSSSITTNGYILSKNIFLKFINAKINNFQITIDEEQHNKFRILKNGKDTKDKIIDNLKNIKSIPGEFTIVIRRNIDKNSNFSFYQEFKEHFSDDKRFKILIHKIFDISNKNNKNINIIENDNFLDSHINYAEKLKLNVLKTNDAFNPCYAFGKDNIVFRPNGEICKCTVYFNKEVNKIGSNNDNIILNSELS